MTDHGSNEDDGDPLVAAVRRLGEKAELNRRPGLDVFSVDAPALGGELAVTRSRFDGEYGNICRILHVSAAGEARMTFAPTALVVGALEGPKPVTELEKLFTEWIKKG